MKIEKKENKTKATGRKAVVQAMAKQNIETKRTSSKMTALTNEQIQEAIRLKAYELYIERGGCNGNDAEDWFTAERIVLQSIR